MQRAFEGKEKRSKPRTMASEISYKRFGGPTYVKQQQRTAGTVQTRIVPSNPNRVTMILVNNSASPIYIGFVPDVSASNGLTLAADGGTFLMNIEDEGEAVSSTIYAIASSDGLLCTLVETLLQVP